MIMILMMVKMRIMITKNDSKVASDDEEISDEDDNKKNYNNSDNNIDRSICTDNVVKSINPDLSICMMIIMVIML